MNTILLILCNALSCFIISTILFQFMNGKYKKSSQSRYVYIVIETVTVIFTTCINMLNHSILNLVVWGVLTMQETVGLWVILFICQKKEIRIQDLKSKGLCQYLKGLLWCLHVFCVSCSRM